MTHTINIVEARDAALAKSNNCLNVHDNLKSLSVEELQALSLDDRLPWHTMCLNITGDLNVGTMIRTSHCLGASSVIVFGRQRIDNRSLVGAGNYIKVEKISGCNDELELNPITFKEVLDERNLTPVFVECGGIPLHHIDWGWSLDRMRHFGKELCFVMGNETDGIPQNLLDIDFPDSCIVSIPQKGVIRSLNVAVAHAIVAGSLCKEMKWM